MKITLIGDSIFDNKVYVGSQKSTIERLQEALPSHECELLAVDGAVTRDITNSQIDRISKDTNVIFVSTGGNDALHHSDILYSGFDSNTLEILYKAQENFKLDYEWMLASLKSLKIPFAVFTIYEGSFPDIRIQNAAAVAISIFNDVIYRLCRKYNVKVIETRELFTDEDDYANPIEPSSLGSKKLAEAMRNSLKKNG